MKHGQLTDYLKKNPGTSPLPFVSMPIGNRHVISGLSHIHGLGMAHADIKAASTFGFRLPAAVLTICVAQHTGR
jgi:hypothetical protein